ncbi:MAG: hypothetical protein LBD02_10150 [Christensenellaceae bacterium]|jgi:hypothetical protein|nr:hypothetical protein [Christensenellaceae bacterium]
MPADADFARRARETLLTSLSGFQNGKMNCDGQLRTECPFCSAGSRAGERREIVNRELGSCRSSKAMEEA